MCVCLCSRVCPRSVLTQVQRDHRILSIFFLRGQDGQQDVDSLSLSSSFDQAPRMPSIDEECQEEAPPVRCLFPPEPPLAVFLPAVLNT